MYPVLFHIGPVAIESFWVMVFLGFVASGLVTREEFRRRGLDPGLAYDLILYAYVGGLVGARLFLVFTYWDRFLEDPFTFLLSGSGWVFYGSLIGGALAVLYGTWRLRIPLEAVADAAGPAIAIGQAIGRLGCQLAGDGDYGIPSSLPWAMSYPDGVVPTTERVHPTPIYEALAYFAIFYYLWRRRGQLRPGEPLALYLISASGARFLVEFVRLNTVYAMGLTVAQWTSLAMMAFGAVLLLMLPRVKPVQPVDGTESISP
jgi:phosphatidylglycerol---prolipoprotein diacylglyceryl transferase